MASKGPGEERTLSNDDPVFILVVIGSLYFGGWLVWIFGHEYLSAAYGYVRYVEFYLFHLIGEIGELPGIAQIHDWLGTLCAPDGALGVCQRDFSAVQWIEISDSSFYVNIALLLGLLAFCVKLFLRVNATHPRIRFAKAHSIKSFVSELKNAVNPKTGKLLYPHLRLFSELDLISEALDDPMFGMSHTSRQFMYKHGLAVGWRAEPGGFWAPTVDRDKTTELFRSKLGRHWTSSANLSTGETLLAAILMPRVAATNAAMTDEEFKTAMEDSDIMQRWCWDQFVPPEKADAKNKDEKVLTRAEKFAWLKPDIELTKARQMIAKYIGHDAIKVVLEKHAFNRTVLFALYIQSSRLGVLPPAEMRWMRFFDRELWYVLGTFGRQSGFAEGAAVLCHYLYECKAGTSLVEPQLDKAVTGLDMALDNFKFTAADKKRYEDAHPDSVARDGDASESKASAG